MGDGIALKLESLLAERWIVDVHGPNSGSLVGISVNLGPWDGTVESSSFGLTCRDENTLSEVDTVNGANNAARTNRRLRDSNGERGSIWSTIVCDTELEIGCVLLKNITEREWNIRVKWSPSAVIRPLEFDNGLWWICSSG